MVDHDTNYINAVAIPSRKSAELVKAFKLCYDELRAAGFEAQIFR